MVEEKGGASETLNVDPQSRLVETKGKPFQHETRQE